MFVNSQSEIPQIGNESGIFLPGTDWLRRVAWQLVAGKLIFLKKRRFVVMNECFILTIALSRGRHFLLSSSIEVV